MYFFFHFFTGLVLGYLVGGILHDRRWIIPCAVGAIIPDLIDKVIGHVLFPVTIGYGRIYAHTLLASLLILALGIILWMRQSDPGVFAFGLGLFSHGILDLMWKYPENWSYPFLGPFRGHLPPDYIFTLILRELQNPFELIIAIILMIVLMSYFNRQTISRLVSGNRQILASIGAGTAILLCILSGVIIGWGLTGHRLKEVGWTFPEELIIGGIVIGLAAWCIWQWQMRLKKP